MDERELKRELDCCVHEAVYRDDVYRSPEHWRRAGSPYEMNKVRQEREGQWCGFPCYFSLQAPAHWRAVPTWSGNSEAFCLIENSYNPHHTGAKDIWTPAYGVVRGGDGLWKVIWLAGSKIVSQAREPGVAVCLAVLRRVAAYYCAGQSIYGADADRQADEAVEPFRRLFTIED